MIIDQLFTSPLFEQAPMASPEQLAYNKLRAQWDSYQTMTGGGGNTAVSRDPAHAAKLATIPAELARMAAALKAKGIDAEAQYDALSGPAAAPVDANQEYGGISEAIRPGVDTVASVKKLWQYINRNLTDLASNASFEEEHSNQPYIEDRLADLLKTADGDPVTIAFDMGGNLEFDNNVLYVPVGNMWRYRGLIYGADFVKRVVGFLSKQNMAEATYSKREKAQVMIYKYFGQIYDYGDDDGLNYLDLQGELWNQLMDKYDGEIEDIVAREPTDVLVRAAQELKGIAGDMKYELDEAAQGHTIEAHGVRGMDRRTWHKTFKNTDQMIAWAEKHDAEIVGTRDLEQARHHNLSPAKAKGVAEGTDDPAKDALIQSLMGHSVDDPRELWVDLKEIGRGFKTPVSKQIRMALRSLSPDDAYELWDTALEIAGVTQDEIDNMTDDMDDSRDVWDGNLRGVSPPATGQKKTKHKIHKTIYIESQGVAEGETSTPAIYVKGGGKYPGMTIAPKGWSRIRDIKDEGDAYFVMVGNDGDGLNIPKDKVSLHRIKLKNGMPITAKQAFMMLNGRTPDREQGVAKGRQIDEMFADQGSGSTDRDNADYMKRRNAAKKAGYTGRETKAGTWRVFKDGNAVAAAGPFKSADEAAAWIKKHKQGITEGVAETVSMDQAKKVLRRYGADHFKTTSNELHFYKNGRHMSVDLIFNDDATRSVSLSQMNSATRKLKGQGITEMDKSEPSAGRDGPPRPGPDREAKPISKEKMTKDALDALSKSMAKKDDKKKDVKESDTLMLKLQRALIKEGRVKELADDLKTMSDADFMKKYGKAKAAIRKDMKRVDEARTDYTPDEMADMLSGKRSQKQIDADAERTRGPNKAPPTKESTQSRAKRLNEKMSTSDTLAAGPGISRLGKKDMEPEIDFRKGLAGDESEFFEPDVRIGKPVEPNAADTDAFMSAVDSYGEQNPYMQSWGGKFADQDTRIAPLRPGEFNVGGTTWRRVEDPAAAPAKKEVQWIPSSEADSIASWKANNPGKSAADWGSIPAAGKPAAASGLPKMRFDIASQRLVPVDQPVALDLSPKDKDKFDRQTRSVKPADGSGANPNIDAATRDRARAWAAQQNAPGAALAGAMRSSGNPVDTAKNKTDWKTIYNLNKSIIGSNPNSIKPGMKLKMPDGSIYPVQPGDNLTKIAAKQSQIMSEAPKSAAVRLGNAIKRVQGTTAASQTRSVIPSSIPKPEPKKDEKDEKEAKKVDESRAARRALMARIVNGG